MDFKVDDFPSGEDPAAEFLAREQSELAELGIDDHVGVEMNEEYLRVVYEDVNLPNWRGMRKRKDLGANFSRKAFHHLTRARPGSDLNDSAPQETQETLDVPFSPPTATMNLQQQEPESLKKWREEKSELLEEMEKGENDERQRWADKARKELEDWYNRYNEQLDKVKNENRAAQEEFIEDMASTSQGNEWVKVARLCDFNPKVNKTTKDVSRMRSILLRLKQEPLIR
eukprot:gene14438-15942_t